MVTKQSITLAPPCPTCGEPITRPTCPVCYKRHPASQVPSPPPARGGFDRTALHSTRPTYSTRTHAADVEVLFPGLFTQAPQPQQPIDAEIALPGLFPPPAPQPQPASQRPTPRMFNGYEHPGPAPTELVDSDGYAQRAAAQAAARHAELDCTCSVCLLYGPDYCPGPDDTQIIGARRATIEQGRAERGALVKAGQRQADERKRQAEKADRIRAQAQRAIEAGHDPKRVARAEEIALDDAQVDRAVNRYGTTPYQCACGDQQHRWGAHRCKHMLALTIRHNAALPEADEPAAEPQPVTDCPTCGYPTDEPCCPVCGMIIDPLHDDIPAEVLDPAPLKNAMPHQPESELARDADGILWA